MQTEREHGSVFTCKSSRPTAEKALGIPVATQMLLGDIAEQGNRVFGERRWKLIEMRFTRELVTHNGKTTLYLSVTARLEPK